MLETASGLAMDEVAIVLQQERNMKASFSFVCVGCDAAIPTPEAELKINGESA